MSEFMNQILNKYMKKENCTQNLDAQKSCSELDPEAMETEPALGDIRPPPSVARSDLRDEGN